MCIAWAQHELNRQLRSRLQQPKPEYICKLPIVKSLRDHVYSSARYDMVQRLQDLQAKVESDIDGEEMIKLCRHLAEQI